ncbi:unnamed protein product [Fusarium graminearum]|uniref:Chromosome 1, complete genome n=1 Tax=Gibberella zeae (strain ATCC MYA-4620 / CBS 123657 / FGSC 9075 / NRRL 31084 / PH-1) TaxID=229533 RepID=A0A098D0H8_GIBZE|nr:unnamed protein product [Fusarium graminearum]
MKLSFVSVSVSVLCTVFCYRKTVVKFAESASPTTHLFGRSGNPDRSKETNRLWIHGYPDSHEYLVRADLALICISAGCAAGYPIASNKPENHGNHD